MNENATTDSLARVQSESRIPASTWRQWCTHLDMNAEEAVELWDEVGHPLMVANGEAPDLALLLQLRAARPVLYIDDFRDELPAIWQSMSFVDALDGEEVGLAEPRPALLKLYRLLGTRSPEIPVATRIVGHVGTLVLLCAMRPEQFSLTRLVRVLTSEKGTVEDLARLGRRSLGEDDYGQLMSTALDAALELLSPTPPAADAALTEDDSGPTGDEADEAGEAEVDLNEDQAEPEEQDEDEEEDLEPEAASTHPYDLFLEALRPALATALAGDEAADPQVRGKRLQAIQSFDPLSTHVPSMEEARMSPAVEGAAPKAKRPVLTARRSSSGGTIVSTSPGASSGGGTRAGGGGGGSVIRSGGGGGTARPSSASGVAGAVRSLDTQQDALPSVDAAGKLETPSLRRDELDEAVQHVVVGLGKVRELDERIWLLLCEPDVELPDPRALAEAVATAESDAETAGTALRLAAQQQRLRSVLEVPPDRRLNERRFDLELEGFLNAIHNSRRELEPDSRQLISLPKVLDYAAAGLVRLEALRAAVEIVRDAESEDGIEVTPEAASARYEALLGDVTFLAERDVVDRARQQADADIAAVLAAVAADAWIERICARCLDYAKAVVEGDRAASVDALKTTLESAPLELEAPDEGELPGEFPEALARDTALGEIVDRLRVYILREAWGVLREAHRPEETATRLDSDLRRALRAYARITPRRERHQNNPKVALPVASLEKLSGNPELAHLFVRLTTDGRLLFVEDYEDGTYIDVFERRESTKRQMHARARERALTSRSGELQTGSSYLHSMGRTSDPFARTEREVMAARVVDDEGLPVIFDLF